MDYSFDRHSCSILLSCNSCLKRSMKGEYYCLKSGSRAFPIVLPLSHGQDPCRTNIDVGAHLREIEALSRKEYTHDDPDAKARSKGKQKWPGTSQTGESGAGTIRQETDAVQGAKEADEGATAAQTKEGTEGKIPSKPIADSASEHSQKVLIGVTCSRKFFSTRVASILKTWGAVSDLPSFVSIRYYVGEMDPNDPEHYTDAYGSGSHDDIAHLAEQAGISDTSTIVVLEGVADNEYPLVEKAIAIIRDMKSFIEQSNKDRNSPSYSWAMDVDDDTYINMKNLKKFIQDHDRGGGGFQYYGSKGEGAKEMKKTFRRQGLKMPYCMGGPGILMSNRTLSVLASNIDSCVEEVKAISKEIYDDSLFGICLYRETQQGCWNTPDYNRDSFLQIYPGQEPSRKKFSDAITTHPFKREGALEEHHLIVTNTQK